MLVRNDQPIGMALDFADKNNFAFATDSAFSANNEIPGGAIPPVTNNYLLLDGTNYLILDGTDYTLV